MVTKYKLDFSKKGLEKSLSSASITRTHMLAAIEQLESLKWMEKKHNQVDMVQLVAIV